LLQKKKRESEKAKKRRAKLFYKEKLKNCLSNLFIPDLGRTNAF